MLYYSFFSWFDTGLSFKDFGLSLTYLKSFDMYQGILHGILSVPHNIVMNLNNVMLLFSVGLTPDLVSKILD